MMKNLNRWLRQRFFRSVDPARVRAVEAGADDVSSEAQELRRRVREPDALESLVHSANNARLARYARDGR